MQFAVGTPVATPQGSFNNRTPGVAASVPTPQGDAQVIANQQAAAKLGISIPGVNGATTSYTPAQQGSAPTSVGTLNANISTPSTSSTKVPAPIVVTSDAAKADLASKQTQLNQLQTDTANHQAILSTPSAVAPAPAGQTTDTSGDQNVAPAGSLDEQITQILGNLSTDESNIQQDSNDQISDLQKDQIAAQSQLDTQAATALSRLNNIAAGTYPLSPAENSLLSSTAATFQATIAAQTQANASATGQMTELMASLGINTAAPTEGISLIHAAISSGEQKIAGLNADMATSIANLQIGFQKSDYQMVSDAWAQTSKYLNDRITSIADMQKQVSDGAKQQIADLKDFTQMQLTTIIQTQTLTDKEKQDAIDNAFQNAQISETQRHDLQTEAISWANANNGSGGGNFTTTQLNAGAAVAGISISDFRNLDPDTKNYFVNNGSTISALEKDISDGTKTPQEVADLVSTSNLSDSIKTVLYKKYGAQPDGNADSNGNGFLSFLGGAYDDVKGVLGL